MSQITQSVRPVAERVPAHATEITEVHHWAGHRPHHYLLVQRKAGCEPDSFLLTHGDFQRGCEQHEYLRQNPEALVDIDYIEGLHYAALVTADGRRAFPEADAEEVWDATH